MKTTILYFVLFAPTLLFGQPEARLLKAIRNCDYPAIKAWLAAYEAPDIYQDAPWCMWAAYHCGLEGVKLFPHRHNPKGVLRQDKRGESYFGNLLAIAAGKGDTALLRYLIEDCQIPVDDKELNLQTLQEDGWQAIHWAASRGHAPAAAYLLAQGADVHALYEGDGAMPLHYAVSQGHEATALLLLGASASPDAPDGNGWPPLHLAAEVGAYRIALALMEAGANPGRENAHGYTALGIAQENKDTLMARLILDFARRLPPQQNEEVDVILQANMNTVNHLEFAADSNYLLINDNLFETNSGRKATDFGAVMASFSQQPPFLYALEGKEGVPVIWNWQREEKIGKFALEGASNDFLPRNPYFNRQKILESPDGSLLITAHEGIFRAWEVLSGKEVRLPLLSRRGLADISSMDGYVLTIDSAGQAAVYEGFQAAAPLYMTDRSHEGYKLTKAGLLREGKWYYCLYEPVEETAISLLEVRECRKGELQWRDEIKAHITAFSIAPSGRRFAYAATDTSIYIINNGRQEERILKGQHGKTISCLQFSPGGAWLLSGSEDRTARLFEAETGRLIQSYESLLQQDIGSKIGFIEFTPDGRYIHNGRIGKLFDLHQPRVVNLYTTVSTLSPDGQYLARKGLKEHANDLMIIYLPSYLDAYESQASIKELAYFKEAKALKGDGSKPEKIEISPDNRIVVAQTANNTVLAWDRESTTLLFTKTCDQEIDELSFSPDSRRLIIKYYPWGADVLDTQQFKNTIAATQAEYSRTGKWMGYVQNDWLTVTSQEGQEQLRIKVEKDLKLRFAFSHNEQWVAALSAGYGLALWNIDTKEHLFDFEAPNAYNRIRFSPDDKYLAIKIAKRMEIWETATGKKAAVMDDLSYTEADIAFSPDGRFLATTGHKEYAIQLWNTHQWKPAFKVFFPGSSVFDSHYILTTSEGYYWGTRFAARTLSFKKGLRVFPFDQFDLAYNRPDIVMDKLGFTPAQTVGAYRQAYKKRLKKMGFNQPVAGLDELSLPELAISREEIPRITETAKLAFRVMAKDAKFSLERLQVFVNNVPNFGLKGYSLQPQASQQTGQLVEIVLSKGENKVDVSVFNTEGVESLKETVYITYDGPQRPPNLYLIALGVDQFANPAMNLSYPAKDVADIANLFRKDTAVYNEVVVEDHYNQSITLALLRQLKDKLMQTQVDDCVILYVAGHGVVDENLDYFLATYNMDFNRPAEKGIPYDELETLLDGIPARQKLFLLDACHSGEIDKESVALIRERHTEDGEVQFRSFDTHIVPTRLGLDNSFELMKQLFVDLRRGTGATVISSASGVEFAMEGEEWQNGVFTYCLLKGLREGVADLDKNGQVMVSELQQFLAAQVPKLTGGRQQPTFRVENISNDWRVW
ncbi:MAG: ankyrin repeat domain-containing protein [Phaeodactylibacter sp.]|nr:ankyrin repeat domain-containing protein [Phaeodactylibacter sp.]